MTDLNTVRDKTTRRGIDTNNSRHVGNMTKIKKHEEQGGYQEIKQVPVVNLRAQNTGADIVSCKSGGFLKLPRKNSHRKQSHIKEQVLGR